MIDEQPGIVALISAASTALGVLGTLVYSYFQGRSSLNDQIDRRVVLILDQKERTIRDRDLTIADLRRTVEERDMQIAELRETCRNLIERVESLERHERERSNPEEAAR